MIARLSTRPWSFSAMPCLGLLNINKPAGMTSREVVNHVQKLVRPAKAGHAGTLDPLATGVLIVGVGRATRLIEFVQQLPKQYRATFLLGRHSDTEDTEGQVVELPNPAVPRRDQIEAQALKFLGEQMQRPPAYSALKVRGQRAYDLARAGAPPELVPRPIVILALEVLAYDYPQLELRIACSSGTYVRSLGRDLAEALGTAAVMSALVRTAVGHFRLAEAVELATLTPNTLSRHLLPPRQAVAHLPARELTAAELARIARGMSIPSAGAQQGEHFAALDKQGQLAAILEAHVQGLRPVVNFVAG
jgi:tRNA pseudouridine55 synthase